MADKELLNLERKLDAAKVEIERLRAALQEISDYLPKKLRDVAEAALTSHS